MRNELSPIFYESLKHTLVQDRICLKMPSDLPQGYARYAGWNIWQPNWESSSRCFTVWVRDGTDESEYAAWVSRKDGCNGCQHLKPHAPTV